MKRRKGVSELIGTLIMVAITLVAGFAIFGYVNGQAATSENQYGQSVANNVNYLREEFSVVSVQFTHCSGTPEYCTGITVAIYNKGAVTLTISSISVTNVGNTTVSNACAPMLTLTSGAHSTNSSETPATTGVPPCAYGSQSSVKGAAFSLNPPTTPIPIDQVPPTTFTISAGTSPGFMVGANYEVLVQGYYGNAVSVQVTASG